MAALPTFRQLQYLIALSDTLHFTKAAEACFVGQSTLSAGLKELETLMGVALVERDKQNVALTVVGKEVVSRSKLLMEQAKDMMEWANQSGKPMHGTLKMGVIPTIAPFVLPEIMPILRAQYPYLKLALKEDTSADLLNQLHAHELDFVLFALPYEAKNLKIIELFDDELWWIASKNLAGFQEQLPSNIVGKEQQLLVLEEGHCLRQHSLAACHAKQQTHQEIEASSLLTLVQMVESEMGWAFIPEMAVKSGLLNNTSLIAQTVAKTKGKNSNGPSTKRTIALATRASSAKLQEFEELAQLIQHHYKL